MRQVTVIYNWEPEGSWAESPDAPGFSAAGETLSEVQKLAREGLAFYFEEPVQLVESFSKVETSGSLPAESKVLTASTTEMAAKITAHIHPAPSPQLRLIPKTVYASRNNSYQEQA